MSHPAPSLPISLTDLQTICKKVEEDVFVFLVGFTPIEDLSIGDVKTIARFVRDIAFRAFDEYATKEKQL